MPKDDLHFRLRIPDRLKAKVASAAAENHRSMTAEILARLDSTFDGEDLGNQAALAEISQKIDQILDLVRDSSVEEK